VFRWTKADELEGPASILGLGYDEDIACLLVLTGLELKFPGQRMLGMASALNSESLDSSFVGTDIA
jgi:hypothetical protein